MGLYNIISSLLKAAADRSRRYYCICCCKTTTRYSPYSSGGLGICEECAKEIAFTDGCSSFEGTNNVGYICSPMFYKGRIRDAFLKYKFNDNPAYAAVFSEILVNYFENIDYEDFDMMVPVPLSEQRYLERGYNQAELLSERLCSRLSIVHEPQALVRVRHTEAQSGLRGHERSSNVKNAFAAKTELVAGKRIIIFDDIITTGNTVEACAEALKNAGAEYVIAWSLFIVAPKNHPEQILRPPLPHRVKTKNKEDGKRG